MAGADFTQLQWLLLGSFRQGMLGGLALNLAVACVAFAASFVLGHLLALGRTSSTRWLRWPCIAYVEAVRSVPLLIVLFWFYFSLPILFATTPSPVLSAVLALTAYASAYQAENIRAGINAVAPGDVEAARSLGLSRWTILLRIVLAQAHRRMLPTHASYFTSLFKDSSALYIVGLVEVMQAGLIVAERHPGRMLQVYLTVGALFFTVCWTASRAARLIEARMESPKVPPAPVCQPLPLQENHHAHA
ncbi:amino acid ABC transporter permease [Azohydromonas aeria]|uniref:amino acid ABC transporter permease n=1 Tax=Azohydromonas aeria TaxID=2590212 RepID=UPI0012F91E10|nr:amino acid ABC transporter permease [Azohydromonas aeria]